MKIDLENLIIEKAHESFKNGDYTIGDLVNEYLKVIKEKNPEINAFLEVFDVTEQIKIAEEKFKNGTATLMTGIPIAIKDNILFKGHTASAGSKILENYKAVYDSFVVKKLKEAGAIILGRTNMDEFAMGSSNQTSAYGPVLNPYKKDYVAGGSSGGPAASVSGKMSLVALGTETCGSVRGPASFCGLVGLYPTYGNVSRRGIIALGSSLDQVGPMGKNVSDVEILFNSINGYDNKDGTSIPKELRIKNEKLKIRKKIGIPREFLKGEGIDKEVLENFKNSCDKLKNAGYELIDIDLPLMKYSLAVYYILQPAEASSNLARYDGMRYGLSEDGENLLDVYKKTKAKGFGKEVKRRILLGTYILSHGYYDAYYNTAFKMRMAIKKELNDILNEVDVILTPTTPFPAFKLGEKMDDPVAMYLSDIFSAPANISGIPSISLPSGFNSEGLPIGIQFTGPAFGENILFSVGKDFEKLAMHQI